MNRTETVALFSLQIDLFLEKFFAPSQKQKISFTILFMADKNI